MTPSELHHDPELGYTLKTQHANKAVLDVTAYCILGIEHTTQEILWRSKDVSGSPTTNLEEAEVFMKGFIKWDGCSNWSFYPADNCMIHFCGMEHADQLHKLWKWIYDIAAQKIEGFDPL